MWFFVLCAAVAAAAAVALVVGRVDGTMGEATSSLAHQTLPDDRPLTDADIAAVRFDVGVRGYRMDQVDDVVDRLRDELERLRTERDQLAAAGAEWSVVHEEGIFTAPEPGAARAAAVEADLPAEQTEPAGAASEPASAASEQDEAAPHRPEWI
ncbi:MAG TPA: DivIVA domain-containing protein [Dermatophilaceae bacterium]|nr:DivIVA domain-containing protein [Dermatophilaceae bacterium]